MNYPYAESAKAPKEAYSFPIAYFFHARGYCNVRR